VNFDVTRLTPREARDGTTTGLMAASIAVPVLAAAILLDHPHTHWWYLAGAMACALVAVVSVALFMVLSKGRASTTVYTTIAFAVTCLALAALGLLAAGTSDSYGTFAPAVMVGVVFVGIIGNRAMRVAVAIYAIALVAVLAWTSGLRGGNLAATIAVSASTIVIVTAVTARTVGPLNERSHIRRSIGALRAAIDGVGSDDAGEPADSIQAALGRGLPLVPDIIPADRVAVFARSVEARRFVLLAAWPGSEADMSAVAEGPELHQALDSDCPVLTPTLCALPIGYCPEGELVMVVRRPAPDTGPDPQAADAEAVAAAFLRVTSRATFARGPVVESRTDALTGLANRRILFERIQIEMDHAIRSESPLSVAMIDLDHFKQYNERHGQVAGDTVLRSIAAVMVSNLRHQDLVVRYGGEEFFLVMPDTDILGGHHLLDKLRAGGRDATSDFGVTLSAGLTSWDGIEDTAALIERADQALYRAKESGRDRVVSIQSFTEF
jgi:diguanylate cyclase (GGDEF)-like protein